jgi:hypothetical protein
MINGWRAREKGKASNVTDGLIKRYFMLHHWGSIEFNIAEKINDYKLLNVKLLAVQCQCLWIEKSLPYSMIFVRDDLKAR